MELPKIDTTNLWDKTYALLKENIIRRKFNPNQKLSIPELSVQLGVSRTPVRDALNRLEMEGLVKTVSKVGTFVVAITAHDVLNIMDTRLMLEYWVVEKLAGLDRDRLKQGLSRMENILNRSLEKVENNEFDEYLKEDYNLQFHIEFMELGQNKNNIEMYLRTMNYRYITYKSSIVSNEMVEVAQKQHREIVESIRRGETQDIKRVIHLHLEDSKERLLKAIEQNSGVV
ncbi:GntR family transcriptional regulator [Paenibacillus thalictri]|uniref:GntR family transcriptional regulator n=1 Tax=Paenibacillus thalictri TaxID=2527873 RepID=UPI0013EF3F30|nr:GntR family transcriptional regulator [Paenibacillus thalictri]